MNAGAYGGETKDVLIEARGVDRQGNIRTFSNADMGYTYRHSSAPEDVIFTQALFQGRAGDPAAIAAAMDDIAEKRKASQPPNKTCGSTFKNPPGDKAWQLIDAAGCRGLTVGARAGFGTALQFPDQPRRRHRGRHRNARRNRPPPRQGDLRRRSRMGDQADRSGLSAPLTPASTVKPSAIALCCDI